MAHHEYCLRLRELSPVPFVAHLSSCWKRSPSSTSDSSSGSIHRTPHQSDTLQRGKETSIIVSHFPSAWIVGIFYLDIFFIESPFSLGSTSLGSPGPFHEKILSCASAHPKKLKITMAKTCKRKLHTSRQSCT